MGAQDIQQIASAVHVHTHVERLYDEFHLVKAAALVSWLMRFWRPAPYKSITHIA